MDVAYNDFASFLRALVIRICAPCCAICALLCLLVCGVLLSGCASIISSTHYSKSSLDFIPPSYNPLDSPIAYPYRHELKAHPMHSGAMIMEDGLHAFLQRVALVRKAKFSLEIQTYIYKDHIASRILMHEIWQAANRGVKVRLLIDDNGLDSDYSDIIALDSHPNISVKIFNPYRSRIRALRVPELLLHFPRVNRRMHNKLFIADSVAVIIGGRNITDRYFNNNDELNFLDHDVLFLGDIALQAEKSFLAYWNYHRAISVDLLPSARKLRKIHDNYAEIIAELGEEASEWQLYEKAIERLIVRYESKQEAIYFGKATLIADPPSKIDAKLPKSHVYDSLRKLINEAQDSLYISSAYFVPGKRGLKQMQHCVDRGVTVSILTNSLASTDSLPVYAGWERYRDRLVGMGVHVYEYRQSVGKRRFKGRFTRGASLHSKTLVFDERKTWVGSFNLDARSSVINTEVAAIFDNEAFAKEHIKLIHSDMQNAWHVEHDGKHTSWCVYSGLDDDGAMCVEQPPDTTWYLRAANKLLKMIPESQL